jgi:hypothetical protein
MIRNVSRRVWPAEANARSGCPTRWTMWAATLSPRSSYTSDAPGASAAAAETTTGSVSYSISISSQASSASARDSATTAATASPA